jgi:hypothetical protein
MEKLDSFGASPSSILTPNPNGNIDEFHNTLTSLEGSPETVNGDFGISSNHLLTSLKFGPKYVSGDYQVNDCDLISLVGSPNTIGCDFNISNNANLTSLLGGPVVAGSFHADNCGLLSLLGSPTVIKYNFGVSNNPILSLEGGPTEVGGYYAASECRLTSLQGLPTTIGEYLDLSNNPLTSLVGINTLREMDGWLHLQDCLIASHILGVFFIKGCRGIETSDDTNFGKAVDILNCHISKGRAGLLQCQKELIEAGLADFAQI